MKRALRGAGWLAAAVLLPPALARAETAAPARWEASASVGGALPFGDLEEGSALRDVSFGAAPFQLALSYPTTSAWSATLAGAYAVSIPTLCANPSDCAASLGRDVGISLSARYAGPTLGRVQPALSLGAGYEWFTSRLSARGATSSRSLHGFVTPVIDVEALFRVGEHWKLGPFLRGSSGRFTGGTWRGPSGEQAPLAREGRWHAWLELGFRASFRR